VSEPAHAIVHAEESLATESSSAPEPEPLLRMRRRSFLRAFLVAPMPSMSLGATGKCKGNMLWTSVSFLTARTVLEEGPRVFCRALPGFTALRDGDIGGVGPLAADRFGLAAERAGELAAASSEVASDTDVAALDVGVPTLLGELHSVRRPVSNYVPGLGSSALSATRDLTHSMLH